MSDARRVLAVDDSLTIRKALELILTPAGHAVTFAASGAEALASARQSPPDVILLDFILPDLRGSEVCRALREDPATAAIPVVLISARGAEIEQAYRDLPNVVRYLGKPFAPEDVLAVVAEARAVDAAAAPAAPAPVVAEDLAAPLAAAAEDDLAVVEAPASSPVASDAGQPAGVDLAGLEQAAAVDETTVATAPAAATPAQRRTTSLLLETLRAGLEGVFVEELDTPGALADRAQSYTELAARVREQLAEALRQAESGAPYALCDDGSIRSLGETLLDGYRRVCRLVFRAAAAGVLTDGSGDGARPRVLVACHKDSPVYASLARAVAEADDWLAVQVASDFRQLPMTVRLFAPTHVLVDAAPGGPVWDQLALVRRLPEGQRLQCIGVRRGAADPIGEGMTATVAADTDLLAALRAQMRRSAEASPTA
ncbi:MAG: response regulator [Deltaproteobacteria bacterium]|nr:response regulator [Deltaproteobacteria bacterium]